MSALNLTQTRLAILQAIADGKVVHVKPLDVKKSAYDEWEWIPGARRKVTKDVTLLSDARLIRRRPANVRATIAFRQTWELTAEGEKTLTDTKEA